jgi:hypothetical protein
MLIIPLQATPAQTLSCQLESQDVGLTIRQKAYGLFVDIYVGGTLILGGAIAENLNRMVRSEYLGFIGDLIFIDNQGSEDPDYTGLGDRFVLAWLDADDVAALPESVA